MDPLCAPWASSPGKATGAAGRLATSTFALRSPTHLSLEAPNLRKTASAAGCGGKYRGCKACLANGKKLFAESWDLLFEIPWSQSRRLVFNCSWTYFPPPFSWWFKAATVDQQGLLRNNSMYFVLIDIQLLRVLFLWSGISLHICCRPSFISSLGQQKYPLCANSEQYRQNLPCLGVFNSSLVGGMEMGTGRS